MRIVILGAGGLAREIADIVDACRAVGHDLDTLGFIVEPKYGKPGDLVNGKPILGDFDWFEGRVDEAAVVCGVGAPELRKRFAEKAAGYGVKYCSLVHPTVVTTRWNSFGEGVVVAAGCILTNNIHVGNHVLINLGCTIGHDVVLEPYSNVSPGVHISGNVHVMTGSYIGTGTSINQRIRIGAWSIIGSGSTIIADVPDNTTVVGTPGRVIKTRSVGWHLGEPSANTLVINEIESAA